MRGVFVVSIKRLNGTKRSTKEKFYKLSQSIRFRAFCRLHGLPELAKCMGAMTKENPSARADEIEKTQEALSKKLGTWDETKIAKSRSKNFLLAMVYIMIKTLVIDEVEQQKNQIYDTKDNVKNDMHKLATDNRLQFVSCNSFIPRFQDTNEEFFKKSVDDIVKKINQNNLTELNIFENKETETKAQQAPPKTPERRAASPETGAKPQPQQSQKQKMRQVTLLLPDTFANVKKNYDGYMELYNHPTRTDAWRVTKVTGYDKPAFIPDYSAINNITDTKKLDYIRLAIEKLKTKKYLVHPKTDKNLIYSSVKEVSKEELTSKILDPAIEEIDKKIAPEFKEESSETTHTEQHHSQQPQTK